MNESTRGLDFVLITNRKVCETKLTDIIEQAVEGGVGTVQLREKDLSTIDLYSLAKEIREITERKGANLIINDRVDIAIAVDADGAALVAVDLAHLHAWDDHANSLAILFT